MSFGPKVAYLLIGPALPQRRFTMGASDALRRPQRRHTPATDMRIDDFLPIDWSASDLSKNLSHTPSALTLASGPVSTSASMHYFTTSHGHTFYFPSEFSLTDVHSLAEGFSEECAL